MRDPPAGDARHGRHKIFVERLLIAAAFALILWLLWQLRTLLVVVMGAVVIAVALRSIAAPIARRTGLSERLAVAAAILAVAAALAAIGWLFGSQIASQIVQLREAIPASWEAFEQQVYGLPLGSQVLGWVNQDLDPGRLGQAVMMAGNAVGTLLVIVFGSIFFAVQPRLYTKGLLLLLPASKRPLVGEALGDAGSALKLWLLGQLISMVVVGLLTGVGLWLAGVPSPLALGLIAGLTEGVPYVGPVVGAIPGLLVALLEGPETAAWALLVYVAVQQIEGNTLVPLIQHRTVSLPPALTLFFIIAAGLIFGIVGLVFATPLLVVIYVMVKRLYVREALNTYTPVPGEADEKRPPGGEAGKGD